MRVLRGGSVRDDLATLFGDGAVGRLGDAELLERFASGRGDASGHAAFATLVERHGPMVRAVCRRALGDGPAADDAFQATFLVLARRAAAVRVDDTLGRWLYGVSVRVATRARARSRAEGRRSWGLDGIDPPDRSPAPDPLHLAELRAALDEEIAKLPPRYRSAVVLCDIEGLPHDQAARRLRCPLGTVQSRLHRARERLRSRLSRRGLAPSAGLMMARPAVPPALAAAAARVAVRSAIPTAPGTIPAAVSTLAEEVSKAMVLGKLKIVAASSLAVVAVISGAALAALQEGTPSDATPPTIQERRGEAGADTPRPAPTPAYGEEGRGGQQGQFRASLPELSGAWDIIYLSGTVSGTRRGRVLPDYTIPIESGAPFYLPVLAGSASHPDILPGDATDPINLRRPTRYVLAPEGEPGTIDFIELGSSKTFHGIYRLEGDTLAICYDSSGEGRPEAFADTKESEHLLILRRSTSTPIFIKGHLTGMIATPADLALPLANPSVEQGEGQSPAGWSRGAAIPGVEYIWDRDTGYDGGASLCLKKTADRYFPIAQWSQEIPREGDAPRLKVSAWIKADEAAKAILDVQFVDADGEWSHAWASYIGAREADDPPVTHDWTHYEGVVTIPPGTRHLIIAPQIYGPGTVWFDDLRAEYTDDPETDPTGP